MTIHIKESLCVIVKVSNNNNNKTVDKGVTEQYSRVYLSL